MKKQLLLLALSLGLAACAAEPARVAPFDPASLGKIQLNTQDVRIINRSFAVPQSSPYIGHNFTPTIAEAAENWVNNRIQAVGSSGHTTIIIKDASLTERPLEMDDGLTSVLWRQQATKYVGRVEVEIQSNAADIGNGIANAHAVHAITLPHNPTEKEKYAAYQQLLSAMMRDFDSGMQQSIMEHMGKFLATSVPEPMPMAAPTVSSAMPPQDDSNPIIITGGVNPADTYRQ